MSFLAEVIPPHCWIILYLQYLRSFVNTVNEGGPEHDRSYYYCYYYYYYDYYYYCLIVYKKRLLVRYKYVLSATKLKQSKIRNAVK